MRVLVVDDSRAMRRIMRKALAFAGLEGERVLEAEHGAAALDVIRESPPELVLSDVNMPVMGGDALLDAMREEGHLNSSRIIMVTSTVGATKALDLVRRGATKVLRKPFDPLSLHAELREYFELDEPEAAAEPPLSLVPPLASEPEPFPTTEIDAAHVAALAPVRAPADLASYAAPLARRPSPLAPRPSSLAPAMDLTTACASAAAYASVARSSLAPPRLSSVAPPSPGPELTEARRQELASLVPPGVATDADLAAAALEATRTVLEVSLMELSEPATSLVPAERMLLVASVEMHAPRPAELSILSSYDVATRLARNLCGEPPDGDDLGRFDALAEIVNMVAGRYLDQTLTGGVGPNMFGLPYIGVLLPGEAPDEQWLCAELDGEDAQVFVRLAPLEESAQ